MGGGGVIGQATLGLAGRGFLQYCTITYTCTVLYCAYMYIFVRGSPSLDTNYAPFKGLDWGTTKCQMVNCKRGLQ
jgi:hypothetical protein